MKALWSIYGTTVLEFNASQIATGTVTPIHQFSIADSNYTLFDGMAFDRAGDLWIAEGNTEINSATSNYTGRVIEFSAAELALLGSSPSPSPVVTLTLGGAGFGLAFDATGNLWTSVYSFSSGDQLTEFTPAAYAVSGTPAAAVTIGAPEDPGGLVFASDGTLWCTPHFVFGPSGGYVSGFSPAQLAMSAASPTPAYTLDGNAPVQVNSGQEAVDEPSNQVAFDAAGDLWSIFNGYAFEYAAGALHGPGTTPTTGFQAYPGESAGGSYEFVPGYALAFDASNDLVTDSTANGTSSANDLHYYGNGSYSGTMPASTSATFASSVPALSGSSVGDVLVEGPYVP